MRLEIVSDYSLKVVIYVMNYLNTVCKVHAQSIGFSVCPLVQTNPQHTRSHSNKTICLHVLYAHYSLRKSIKSSHLM